MVDTHLLRNLAHGCLLQRLARLRYTTGQEEGGLAVRPHNEQPAIAEACPRRRGHQGRRHDHDGSAAEGGLGVICASAKVRTALPSRKTVGQAR